jgi:nicotinamide-nucleotide amidase
VVTGPFGATPTPHELATLVAERLSGRSLATAESCTAGRIATALAEVEGAVAWLRGGLIAYQPMVKRGLLEVRATSVLSEESAAEMAVGVAWLLDADVAVAATGVVGPDPEEGVPSGTVFIGVSVDGEPTSTRSHFSGSPTDICAAATSQALRELAAALDR